MPLLTYGDWQQHYTHLHAEDKHEIWRGALDRTAVLFYSGNGTTQTQAVRFLGNQRMITTTNEVVYFNRPGILTVSPECLWVYPEMDEVSRHVSWFQGAYYQFKQWVNGVSVDESSPLIGYTPSYPLTETGSVVYYGVSDAKRSLGQSTDLAAHQRKYDALIVTKPDNIIALGVSRGAATTFSALACHAYANVKLCVLEGVPSSIRALFKSYFSPSLGKYLYNNWTAYWFLGHQHQTDKSCQAFGHVERFPNDVPLVIVTSQKDKVVPHEVSAKLAWRVAYKRIQARDRGEGVAPVYLLQLDHAGHDGYARGDTRDGQRYQHAMHAIYRQHGLPYIADYADQGESELWCAELTQGALQQQVRYQGRFKANKHERQEIRAEALSVFYQQRQTWDEATKARATTLCQPMPLYAKKLHSSWFSFFTPNPSEALFAQEKPAVRLKMG